MNTECHNLHIIHNMFSLSLFVLVIFICVISSTQDKNTRKKSSPLPSPFSVWCLYTPSSVLLFLPNFLSVMASFFTVSGLLLCSSECWSVVSSTDGMICPTLPLILHSNQCMLPVCYFFNVFVVSFICFTHPIIMCCCIVWFLMFQLFLSASRTLWVPTQAFCSAWSHMSFLMNSCWGSFAILVH